MMVWRPSFCSCSCYPRFNRSTPSFTANIAWLLWFSLSIHFKWRGAFYLLMSPRSVFHSMIFDEIRPRNPSMSFWSQVSLFHTLRDLPFEPFTPEPSSRYLSSVMFNSSRTSWHPWTILSSSIFCWLVSSLSGRTMSTSWRTIERLRTLLVGLVTALELINSYENSLGSDCLELLWTINKSLAELVCKVGYGDDVAYTITKAHG